MAIALQILAGGFAAGAVYGLVAVGHSLVFRLTGVVHFAFGELIALGVFVTLFVAAGSGPVSQTSVGGGRFLLALVVGLVVTAAASVGAYFLAIEPYRARGSVIGWVGASLAVAFTIRTLLVVFFDRPAYVFPDPIPFRRLGDDGVWHLGGATIQVRSIFVAAAALVLAALGMRLLQRTRFGRALEAIAQDFDAAVIVGLPVSLLVGLAFALAGVGASLAAVLAAPSTAFDVDAAARYGLYGLVAAVVAWFDARQALLAGIALGLIQATVTSAHWGGGPAAPRRDPARARARRARLALPGARRRSNERLRRRSARACATRVATGRAEPSLAALVLLVAAFVPLVTGDARLADLASGLYLACAAVGLGFVAGVAGLPSLAQGAFMATGAMVAAHLLEHGVPTGIAALAGGIAGGAAGALVGGAFVRLPRAGLRRGDLDRVVARRPRGAIGDVAARRRAGNRRLRRPDDGRALRARARPDRARRARIRRARAFAVRARPRGRPRARARGGRTRRAVSPLAHDRRHGVGRRRRARRSTRRTARGRRRTRRATGRTSRSSSS